MSQQFDPRPSWDVYFMRLATEVATRGTCLRRQVGSVIVAERRILTTGYNGSPPELPHCITVGCYLEDGHCVRTLHAEQNAILQAALHGISIRGSVLYTTTFPCHVCARMIVGAGIQQVVFRDDLPNWSGWAMEIFRMAPINVARMEEGADKVTWIRLGGQDWPPHA